MISVIGYFLIAVGALLVVATIALALGNKIEFRIFGLLPLVIGAALILIGSVL